MFCPKCGSQNEDYVKNCIKCGEPIQATGGATQNIPNYLVQSILVTLFCCLPFGIAAIVYAAQVNGKVQAGDIQGAMTASKNAKMWCWISFGLGLLVIIIYLFFIILGAMAGGLNGH